MSDRPSARLPVTATLIAMLIGGLSAGTASVVAYQADSAREPVPGAGPSALPETSATKTSPPASKTEPRISAKAERTTEPPSKPSTTTTTTPQPRSTTTTRTQPPARTTTSPRPAPSSTSSPPPEEGIVIDLVNRERDG